MQDFQRSPGLPPAQGLYNPRNERDNCGMGFVASMRGEKTHEMIDMGIEVLIRLTHAGENILHQLSLEHQTELQKTGPELESYKETLDDAIEATQDALTDADKAQKEIAPPVRRKQ